MTRNEIEFLQYEPTIFESLTVAQDGRYIDPKSYIRINARLGKTILAIVGEKLVAAFGYRITEGSEALVWMWIDPEYRRLHKREIVREANEWFPLLLEQSHGHRLVATVDRDFVEGHSFLLHYGFHPYGFFHHYDFRMRDQVWYERRNNGR